MSTITISFDTDLGQRQCIIPLSETSPWCALLGDWAMPATGSLEAVEQCIGGANVKRAEFQGSAAACLLPMIWVRSIWLDPNRGETVFHWINADETNMTSSGMRAAARLTCVLASRVRCEHPERVKEQFGFDPGDAGVSEDIFDLLTNIVDVWDPNLRSAVLGDDWTSEMRKTLTRCAFDGHRRIGIYGAGTHTRGVGDALMEPSVEICCVIDDDARRHGERIWGFPIVSPQQAIRLDLDAVVISANSIEDLLWERAHVFREQGIVTFRLYGIDTTTKELCDAAE